MVQSARFSLKPRQEAWLRGEGLRGVLRGLFFRNMILADISEKLLNEIKGRKDKQLPESEWRKMKEKLGCSLSNYELSLKRLSSPGLVRREEGAYEIVGDFGKHPGPRTDHHSHSTREPTKSALHGHAQSTHRNQLDT